MPAALLWSAAGLFLLWEATGAALWLRDAGDLGAAVRHTRAAFGGDWMALIVLTDHLVIAGIVLLWVWHDLAAHGAPAGRRLAWAAAFVALGSPTLLAYLARRSTGALGAGARRG